MFYCALILFCSFILCSCSNNAEYLNETQFRVLETIDVSKNIIGIQETESLYVTEEHSEYEYRREPDIELPDVSGFDKDAYGNYILSEEALTGERLPLNSNGQIDYIFYYDSNDNVVNPMPEYYENYPEYFTMNGG